MTDDRSGAPSLEDRLTTAATTRAVGVALAAYGVLLVALLVSSAWVKSHAATFAKPDLAFGYDHATVVAALGALGEAGRTAYAVNLVVDTLEPAALSVATVLVAARAFPGKLPVLLIAPTAFFVLDLVENVSFGIMIAGFPDVPAALVALTSPITMVKLVAFLATFPTLVAGVVTLVRDRLSVPLVRYAAWALAVFVAAVGVASLDVQPTAFTPPGVAAASVWAVALIASADRARRVESGENAVAMRRRP